MCVHLFFCWVQLWQEAACLPTGYGPSLHLSLSHWTPDWLFLEVLLWCRVNIDRHYLCGTPADKMAVDEKWSIKKFNRSNLTTWKFQMWHLLLAKGLWGLVKGTNTQARMEFQKKSQRALILYSYISILYIRSSRPSVLFNCTWSPYMSSQRKPGTLCAITLSRRRWHTSCSWRSGIFGPRWRRAHAHTHAA